MKDIDTIAAELEAAKIAEARATAARIDLESQLVALVGVRDEGSQTHRGDAYKVTVTGVVNRTVDQAVVPQLLADEKYRWAAERMFPAKFGLDGKELRFFMFNEPQFYAQLAQAITAKPGKPQVRIEACGVSLREAA